MHCSNPPVAALRRAFRLSALTSAIRGQLGDDTLSGVSYPRNCNNQCNPILSNLGGWGLLRISLWGDIRLEYFSCAELRPSAVKEGPPGGYPSLQNY